MSIAFSTDSFLFSGNTSKISFIIIFFLSSSSIFLKNSLSSSFSNISTSFNFLIPLTKSNILSIFINIFRSSEDIYFLVLVIISIPLSKSSSFKSISFIPVFKSSTLYFIALSMELLLCLLLFLIFFIFLIFFPLGFDDEVDFWL